MGENQKRPTGCIALSDEERRKLFKESKQRMKEFNEKVFEDTDKKLAKEGK